MIRTPTVLQMEAVECGAAALGIVLAHHGRFVPLAELREACGVSRDGSKASNIVKAARRYGLVAKGLKKEVAQLRELRAPFVVFWNFNHFVVVEGFRRGRVHLNDPAFGPRTVSDEELDESFTGVVLTFEPGPGFARGGRAPSLRASIAPRLAGFRSALAYVAVASALLVVPGLVAPALTKVFVDHVLVERRLHWVAPLLLGVAIVAVVKGLLTHLQLLTLRRLHVGLAATLAGRFLWHVLRLPVEFYGQRFAGEIANRVRINDRVAQVLSGKLTRSAIDVAMAAVFGVVMVVYDRPLSAIVFLAAFGNLALLSLVARRRADSQLRVAQEMGKAEGIAIGGLQGMETLKSGARESSFFQRWAGHYTKGVTAQQEIALSSATLGVLPQLLSGLSTLLLLAIGGLRVMEGQLTLGDLVAFQSLMRSFMAPVVNLVDLASTAQELRADLERLDDVLAHPVDARLEEAGSFDLSNSADLDAIGGDEPVRLRGRVELRDVTFGYSPIDEPLIRNFNLRIEAGQRVAIVGASGSGKSTIARLIAGLHQPWEGGVLFDGKLARTIPRIVLTTSVAFVEQEILLFAGTVRENLTLWDDTVAHAALVQAVEDAALGDVVRQLPHGYDAELLEGGANLSGGQRQRLEIARALVYDPAVIVLDEATSALDTETEQTVDRNLRRRGATCLIIAHRLSAIRDCDQIVVLKHGKIVQRGTHEQLWADQRGEYADLIRAEGEAVLAR